MVAMSLSRNEIEKDMLLVRFGMTSLMVNNTAPKAVQVKWLNASHSLAGVQNGRKLAFIGFTWRFQT